MLKVNDGASTPREGGQRQLKDISEHGFAMVPNRIFLDEQLSSSARLVYCALCAHAYERKTHCYPSVMRLAKKTGLGERTVRRAVKELESSGWLRVHRRIKKTSVYYLLMPDGGSPRVYAAKSQIQLEHSRSGDLLPSITRDFVVQGLHLDGVTIVDPALPIESRLRLQIGDRILLDGTTELKLIMIKEKRPWFEFDEQEGFDWDSMVERMPDFSFWPKDPEPEPGTVPNPLGS